jgi:type IV pilus assembly protein PilV
MKISDNNKGFTLLEVLVAVVVLSIGLLGMASLTIGVIKGNKFSKRVTTATILAQEKMEDARKLGYAGTPSSDQTVTEDYGSIPSYPFFKRVTLTDVDNPAAGMKTFVVTVYWDSGGASLGGGGHSVALQTIVSQ